MKKIESYWWKILAVGIILIVAWKVLDFSNVKSWIKSAFDIMMPFIIGAVLAFFTNKPSKAIEEFLKRKAKRLSKKAARVISVLSVYAVLIAILAFSLNFLIPALYVNMQDLVKNAPSYYETIKNFTDNSEFLSSLGILDKISESVMSYINFSMMGKFVGIVSSVANSVLTFFLGIILSIYILLEKESLANFFKTLGKLVLKGKHSATVAMYCGEFAKLFNSYFLGLMFDALLMGVLSSIFFALFGAPFPLLLGLCVAIGNMIPFFGPIASAAVGYIATAVSMGPLKAIWVLLFQLVLGQVDGNLIQPKIVGTSVGISPFWVIFAVTFFGGIWGPWGMILGVPIVGALGMLYDDLKETRGI